MEDEKKSSGLDFDTVLSPGATQLLKTIFQKNAEKQAEAGRSERRTTEIPATASDLTPDAQTLQMKTFSSGILFTSSSQNKLLNHLLHSLVPSLPCF